MFGAGAAGEVFRDSTKSTAVATAATTDLLVTRRTILTCQDSLPCPQQVGNFPSMGKLRGNLSNGFLGIMPVFHHSVAVLPLPFHHSVVTFRCTVAVLPFHCYRCRCG